MRRHLLTIAIFLLAGAVVNVAVAWGCALLLDLVHSDLLDAYNDQYSEIVWGYRRYQRPGVRIDTYYRLDHESIIGPWAIENGRGWPMIALWNEGEVDEHGEYKYQGAIVTHIPIYTGPMMLGYRTLPLRPFWPSFAVNTIFYAAVLWLLIPGPFALRRLIRQRRGLCPKCAYPMGESAVCTECGAELPTRKRSASPFDRASTIG